MNISLPKCPKAVNDSLNAAVTPALRTLANLPSARWAMGEAHEVFYLPAIDLVHQVSLSNARLVAWRMSYTAGNRAIAAEVDVSVRPDNTEVTALNEGPFASEPDAQLKALRQARANGTFELRILRIPEVYLMAVWLHAREFDLVVPLKPAPAGLLAGQEYSVRGLATALSSAVRQLTSQPAEVDS